MGGSARLLPNSHWNLIRASGPAAATPHVALRLSLSRIIDAATRYVECTLPDGSLAAVWWAGA